MSLTVPKLQIVRLLPYTGKSSLDLRAHLRRTIEKNILSCKLNVVFRSICRLGNLLRFNDSIEKEILSEIVYRYTCSNCKVNYDRKLFWHIFTKTSEHMTTSNLIGKHIKNAKDLRISQYLLQCDSPITFDDFDILASNFKKSKLFIKESLLIKPDQPVLNKTVKRFLLDRFD